MGCGSSAQNLEEENVNKEELKTNLPETTKKEFQTYEDIHKRIEIIVNDINSKFKDDFYNFLDGLITEDVFFKRYENLLNQNKILKSDIHNYGLELDILRKLQRESYRDYDLHSFLDERLKESYPNLSEKNQVEFKNMLEQSNKIFPKLQKGLIYEINDDENHTLNTAKILKYNENFSRTEIINFQISFPIKNIDVLKEVADVIKLNFYLITVIISVSFDNTYKADDPLCIKFFDFLNLFLENIKVHNYIKAFVLMFDFPEDKKFNFPQNFYVTFFNLVKTKYLLSLVVINVPFSDEIGKKLSSAIGFNETLKFLLFIFTDSINSCIDDLVTAFNKIKSLSILSLIGGSLEPTKVEELSKKLTKLKIFDYRKEI